MITVRFRTQICKIVNISRQIDERRATLLLRAPIFIVSFPPQNFLLQKFHICLGFILNRNGFGKSAACVRIVSFFRHSSTVVVCDTHWA